MCQGSLTRILSISSAEYARSECDRKLPCIAVARSRASLGSRLVDWPLRLPSNVVGTHRLGTGGYDSSQWAYTDERGDARTAPLVTYHSRPPFRNQGPRWSLHDQRVDMCRNQLGQHERQHAVYVLRNCLGAIDLKAEREDAACNTVA